MNEENLGARSMEQIDCSVRSGPGFPFVFLSVFICLILLVGMFRGASKRFWLVMLLISLLPLGFALLQRERGLATAKAELGNPPYSDPNVDSKIAEAVAEVNQVIPAGITATAIPLALALIGARFGKCKSTPLPSA